MVDGTAGNGARPGALDRWRREAAELGARPDALGRAAQWLWAHPAALLLPAAAIGPGLFGAAIPGGDAGWFREAGRSMLGSDMLDVFSSSGLQIGPLYLLLVGVLAAVVDVVGLPVLFMVAAVQSVALAAYALYLAGRWADAWGAPRLAAQWGVVTPVVFLGVLAESIGIGHPEELFLGLALAHLVLLVRSASTVRGGALLGVAVAVKLWAVLGAPLVLLRRGWRPVVVVGVLSATIAAAAYGPFYLFGDARTFEFTWGSGLQPFGIPLEHLALGGWALRLVQAAVVVAVTSAVAWWWPGTGLPAVLVLVATRIVLDPLLQTYYTIPFVVVGLLWAWTTPRRPGALGRLATWPGVLLAMVGPYLVEYPLRVGPTHVAMVVLTVLVVRRDRAVACAAPPERATNEVSARP